MNSSIPVRMMSLLGKGCCLREKVEYFITTPLCTVDPKVVKNWQMTEVILLALCLYSQDIEMPLTTPSVSCIAAFIIPANFGGERTFFSHV